VAGLKSSSKIKCLEWADWRWNAGI